MGAKRVSLGSEKGLWTQAWAAGENGEQGSQRQDPEFKEGAWRVRADPGSPGTYSGSS